MATVKWLVQTFRLVRFTKIVRPDNTQKHRSNVQRQRERGEGVCSGQEGPTVVKAAIVDAVAWSFKVVFSSAAM